MSLWAAHVERTISEEIPAPPDTVRDFYVDLDNIKEFHPLVVSVEVLSHSHTADGFQQAYRVRDRIPLGRLTMRITYWAQVQVPVLGDVITEARQFPRVRLNGTVSFQPTEAGTLLTERLNISAPRPLLATTQREAVNAHIEMLAGIRGHFESR